MYSPIQPKHSHTTFAYSHFSVFISHTFFCLCLPHITAIAPLAAFNFFFSIIAFFLPLYVYYVCVCFVFLLSPPFPLHLLLPPLFFSPLGLHPSGCRGLLAAHSQPPYFSTSQPSSWQHSHRQEIALAVSRISNAHQDTHCGVQPGPPEHTFTILSHYLDISFFLQSAHTHLVYIFLHVLIPLRFPPFFCSSLPSTVSLSPPHHPPVFFPLLFMTHRERGAELNV